MDVLRLLDQLNDLVGQVKTFGPLAWKFDPDEFAMQIHKIKASLPDEMKVAAQTLRESEKIVDSAREDATMALENSKREGERIVSEARAEAERVLEHARAQQDRMVAESEILKLSKAQAEEIRNAADRDAVQMRRGAETYAYDMLNQLESVVGKVMAAVERGKHELERTEQTAVVQVRERTRVG